MRLKSFYAKTMTEAMQMVRETLGDDAVIVATREEKGGKAVQVTAAIEPAYEQEDSPHFEVGASGIPAHEEDWLQYDEEEENQPVIETVTDAMLRHGVPEDVMDQIISCATVIGSQDPKEALIAALEHLFGFRPLPTKAHDKALMLVGPPGSGKTLAAAKLAARAAMKGLRVGVVTTDTIRAGGIEQLEAFTKLLRIDLKRAERAKDLQQILSDLKGMDQIIIDTQGVNPFDQSDLKELARFIEAGSANPLLVMPGGSDAEEAAETARIFSTLGVESMISSRLDIARRLGGLLSAAYYGHLVFSEVSNTPKVADGLTALTPQSLAQLLLPRGGTGGGVRGGTTGYDPLDSRASKRDSLKTGTRS